ncbi:hypothetical protein SDC9_189021 [bioreactor metagenome]|uniref:Uncharacterized protein n=1 Tax=bioreactor metagenome TaxID=1076179 RepID=A0A645HQY6_9ZZZZ
MIAHDPAVEKFFVWLALAQVGNESRMPFLQRPPSQEDGWEILLVFSLPLHITTTWCHDDLRYREAANEALST